MVANLKRGYQTGEKTMNRKLWTFLGIWIFLAVIVAGVSAVNATPITSYNCTPDMPGPTINPGDVIYWNQCYDFDIVRGWYGKVVHETGEPIVDVNFFTHRIFIEPSVFRTGKYYQWADYEEPHANNFMFVVAESNITKQEIANITANESVINQSILTMVHYNLPEKPVADYLAARGDPVAWNNSKFTNLSRVWLFGVNEKVYDYPANDSQLYIPASVIQSLEPGYYKVVVDNPGMNTLIESIYDPEKELITSPIRKTPEIEIAGLSPRVVYSRYLPWLLKYSDDVITEYDLKVEEPYVEIVGINTMYENALPSIRVDGYTNLIPGTTIYCILDEDNRTVNILKPERYIGTATGDKLGNMREFRITVLFDYENETSGQHSVTAHGTFGAFMTAGFPVGSMPAGQERPPAFIKYVNGTIWNPPPPPQIIVQVVTTEVVREVIKEIPVPPSDEQVRRVQEEVIKSYLMTGLIIIAVIGGLLYVRFIIIRGRKVRWDWYRWKR